MSHVRHSRQSGPRLRYTPKPDAPAPVEPRNERPIIRPILAGPVESQAELFRLYNPEVLAAIERAQRETGDYSLDAAKQAAAWTKATRTQRRGYLANANPERDEQGDET